MYKRSHDSNSIVGQIELYEHRIKNVNLIWCDQVLRLSKIKNLLNDKRRLKINDIGCNYFQFYKEIKRKKLTKYFNYCGYNSDINFLKLGLKYFPELTNSYVCTKIDYKKPRPANIQVISATLEHVKKPFKMLHNVLETTSDLIILRTFVGKKNIFELIESKNVASPYNVNQFSVFEIFNIFLKYNFIPTLYRDIATNYSTPYKIKIKSSVISLDRCM